jgi:hypothetical protein
LLWPLNAWPFYQKVVLEETNLVCLCFREANELGPYTSFTFEYAVKGGKMF